MTLAVLDAAGNVIAQADAILALGSRLGPFGTLEQYGIDYWPMDNCSVTLQGLQAVFLDSPPNQQPFED